MSKKDSKEQDLYKRVVLIRHGESLGQTASRRGVDRKRDASLVDCSLSPNGINQAFSLKQQLLRVLCNDDDDDDDDDMQNISFELVCVSPLTRAITTCVLGLSYLVQDSTESFQTKSSNHAIQKTGSNKSSSTTSFICHTSIAETGGSIPENKGRPIATVVKDIHHSIQDFPLSQTCLTQIDFSLVPSCWPDVNRKDGAEKKGHETTSSPSKMIKSKRKKNNKSTNSTPTTTTSNVTKISSSRNKLQDFLEWLYQRPETNIAIVCHHNVILHLTGHQLKSGGVPNCVPIVCYLVRQVSSSGRSSNNGSHEYVYTLNLESNDTTNYKGR